MDGIIVVEVTGQRQQSSLPKGGSEVPCSLVFKHQEKEMMDKMKSLLKAKDYIGGKKSREKQDPGTQQLIASSKRY